MISLEQIKALEAKVHGAVDEITRLRRENETLTDALNASEKRLRDLESLVGEFKNEQAEIEATIVRTLENLDQLEDGLLDHDVAQPSAAVPDGELEAAHASAGRAKAAAPAASPAATPAATADKELEIF